MVIRKTDLSAPRPLQPKAAPTANQSKTTEASRARQRFGDEMSSGRGGALRRAAASQLGATSLQPLVIEGQVPVTRAGRGGGGGNPYEPNGEFTWPLNVIYQRFGAQVAQQAEAAIQQVRDGTLTGTSQWPSEGDLLVYPPNSGSLETPVVGGADEVGHAAVVQSVQYDERNHTVTVRVTERNWSVNDNTDPNSPPYRDLTFKVNDDGSLSLPDGSGLPDGIGFVAVNPERAEPPQPPPPPIGETPDPTNGPWRKDSVTINHDDRYTGCVGYIHDLGGSYLTLMQQMSALYPNKEDGFDAGDIPHQSIVPQPGDLMVWAADTSDGVGFTAYGRGHVAYVERVTPNVRDGQVVSYTITVSEALDPNLQDPRLRTFTVGVNPDGTPALPASVGFNHDVNTGGSTATTTTTSSGGNLSRGPYTVQAGDTVDSIARRAGITRQQLLDANQQITDPNLIIEGQVIRIP